MVINSKNIRHTDYMKNYKVVLTGLFALLLASTGAYTAFAQTTTTPATASVGACMPITIDLHYGSDDVSTGRSVTSLQRFLVTQGFFSASNIGTGHFGPLTMSSVVSFQKAHGVPGTGYVGPLTRGAIIRIGCNTGVVPPTSSAATLYHLSPTTGPVGTTVSITGFGFTNANTILMDGNLAIRNVPISSSIAIACTTSPTCHGGINQTIIFTIPDSLSPNCPVGSMCAMYMRLVTPGTYTVTVQNENGTSNALPFIVTSGSSSQTLTTTGLDAPSTLSLGQTGSWTVHVANGSGNLHYSVVWGDENRTASTATIMAPSGSTQNSATFTHSYSICGNYTPVFTVTDDSGASVSISNTLKVTPLY
jgi:peptidoglycan hydrolase-like protein with peptidoglycan-binding domain